MKLFEKGKIGNLEIKNRVIMMPMGTNADPDGGFSTQSVNYLEARAKGGVGMIITGYSSESETYEKTTCTILNDIKKIGRANRVVEACHAHGTKVCMQLGPGLGRVAYIDKVTPPYSASDDVASLWDKDLMCRALTKEDIAVIVKEVGYEASIAKQAGADAVELRVYGGYLADQFMSSLWNHRTDEYGGSLENRMRFTMELLESIKNNVGEDFPILVKYNPYHVIEGGRQIEEGQEIAKMLEAKGAAALHIDKGCYEVWYNAITTVYQPDAHQLDVAAAIKEVVNIPVINQGKLSNPIIAEKALQDEKIDFVGLGHALLTDPEWVNKVKEGHIKDIVPCIGCNECLRLLHQGKDLVCAINPYLSHEGEYMVRPAEVKKNILVIGGGPGGMEAALIASQRGHKVTLWEKEDHLGGLLLAAGGPDFKKPILDYVQYIIRQVDKSNVDVKYMTAATPMKIKEGNFEHVIIATGAESFVPSVKGINNENVYISTDVLTGKVTLNAKNVSVIGGGLVGCETAAFLAEKGIKVTLIEMLSDIMLNAAHSVNNDLCLRHKLEKDNVDVKISTKLESVEPGKIVITKDGVTTEVFCDAMVIASGYKSNHNLSKALEGEVEYTIIGDNLKSRNIFDAVHEGFNIARNL